MGDAEHPMPARLYDTMLDRILKWLMIMAESEGVGQKMEQLTTSTLICLGLMPAVGVEVRAVRGGVGGAQVVGSRVREQGGEGGGSCGRAGPLQKLKPPGRPLPPRGPLTDRRPQPTVPTG